MTPSNDARLRFVIPGKQVGLWRRWTLSLAVALVVCFACSPSLWACPNCRENLDQQAGDLQFGFALSIGLMLLTPMAIVAGWVLALGWYLRRQAMQVDGLIPAVDRAAIG